MHGLGRLYERQSLDELTDRAILRSLFNEVARYWPEHLDERPGAFSAGGWRGVLGGLDHTLAVRTFIPLPAAEILIDERGAIRARPPSGVPMKGEPAFSGCS